MTFTAFNAISQLPYKHPIQGLVENALKGYTTAKRASYLPQQIEAGIFNKEIAPLAQLASSPNFTGFNPEIQKMISDRIGRYLSQIHNPQGQATEQMGGSAPAGYRSSEAINQDLMGGADATLGAGKKGAATFSRLGNVIEQYLGKNWITDALGGPGPAADAARFKQSIIQGKKNLTMKGFQPGEANVVEPYPGEGAESYKQRIPQNFVNEESPQFKNAADKAAHDAQERADIKATAKHYSTPDFTVTDQMVMEALRRRIKTPQQWHQYLAILKAQGIR